MQSPGSPVVAPLAALFPRKADTRVVFPDPASPNTASAMACDARALRESN
jgi:hypothetical protein